MKKNLFAKQIPVISGLLFFFSLVFISYSGKAQVVINEVSASNLNQYMDNHNDYEDWIELYNTSGTAVNLQGYYLSDNPNNNLKWQIPSGISIAGNGFLRFWISGRNIIEGTHYHTNFKLKQTKNTPEYVVLSNPLGIILDSVKLKKTQLGHSFGRIQDGAAFWAIFKNPTLNSSNNTATPYLKYADKPDFSIPAGFYSSGVTVSISSTDTNVVIRFTTDGTLPTETSAIYTTPVTISTTKVLKARAFSNDPSILPSFIEFATYFINVNHTLPVVSISATQLTTLANGNQSLRPHGTFEYFDLNKQRKANTYGEFNSHGQDSWALSQRSLDFVSRDEMGYNHSIEEKLFNTSNRVNYQRIILRAAGDDNYPADNKPANAGSAHLRDAFIHNLSLSGGLNLDVRRGAKSIVYLNGNYWGVYDLRENPDDHDFTDYYYGQDKFNLQYVLTWGNTWAKYGGNKALTDWMSIVNYVLNNNMNDSLVWQKVNDSLDVTSLVDYVLVNMFTVCSDWLNWNTGVWRGLNPGGQHKKWGYILWDNDATFGHYINYTGIPDTSPDADPCDPEGLTNFGNQYQDAHIKMLNKLRTNPKFEQYYISRQLDLWNTVFGCPNMIAQLDSTMALINPEMTQHAQRWNGTYSGWQNNFQQLKNFIITRCSALTSGFISCYNLNGPYQLTITANPDTAGSVKLNSMVINEFPFTGNYFGGIENLLEAIPDSGNSFIKWTDNFHPFAPDSSSTNVKISLSNSDTVVAHFYMPTAISEKYSFADVFIYPNPNDGNFAVRITNHYGFADNEHCELTIYNLLGEKVFCKQLERSGNPAQAGRTTNSKQLSTNLPAGVYFLEISNRDFRKSVKLVCTK